MPTLGATAAGIHSRGIGRQLIPGKDMEVRLEESLTVGAGKFVLALTKGRPFVAETGRDNQCFA